MHLTINLSLIYDESRKSIEGHTEPKSMVGLGWVKLERRVEKSICRMYT